MENIDLDTNKNIESLDDENNNNKNNKKANNANDKKDSGKDLDLSLEKDYQQIEDEILEEVRIKNEKDKINRELLNQIKIVKKAEALVLKEKQKLIKLTMKREAL